MLDKYPLVQPCRLDEVGVCVASTRSNFSNAAVFTSFPKSMRIFAFFFQAPSTFSKMHTWMLSDESICGFVEVAFFVIRACSSTRFFRLKPLRSSSMSDRCPSLRRITGVHLSQGCPATSSPRDMLFPNFLHFTQVQVLLNDSASIPLGLPSIISRRLSKPASCAAMTTSPRSPAQTVDIPSIYLSPVFPAMYYRVRKPHRWKLAASP